MPAGSFHEWLEREGLIPRRPPRQLTELDNRALALQLVPLPEGQRDGMHLMHIDQPQLGYFDHTVTYEGSYVFDCLKEERDGQLNVWMSATPQEFQHIIDMLDRFPAGGNLLMSGLGLGVALRIGADRIGHATVVERDPRVIELVWPHVEQHGWTVVQADIEQFLEGNAAAMAGLFDCVYLDTWEAGDCYLLGWINRLCRLARPMLRPDGYTVLWSYDEMLEDLRYVLTMIGNGVRRSYITEQRDPGLVELQDKWPPFVPFARWMLRKRRTESAMKSEIENEIRRWCRGERDGMRWAT